MRERLDVPANIFDKVLLGFVIKSTDDEDYDQRVLQYRLAHEAPRQSLGEKFDIYESLFAVIDAKSGALLTHVSIMIAAAAYVASDNDWGLVMQFAFSAILASLLFIAICLIRCLRSWTTPPKEGNQADFQNLLDRELHRRSELYRYASQLAFMTTIISSVVLILAMW